MVSTSKRVNPNHIFVDTNILIGAYSEKKEFQEEAACLHYLTSLVGKKIYISTLSVAQLVSTLQNRFSRTKMIQIVKELRHRFEVLSFTKEDIDKSIADVGTDIEDNMQHIISTKANCRIIVTKNAGDYSLYQDIYAVPPARIRSIPR